MIRRSLPFITYSNGYGRKGDPTASASGSKHTENDVVSIIWNRVLRLANNEGWVSVGVDHDTSEFAVASIESLVAADGLPAFPAQPQRLLITADGGGSNGIRCRLWKVSLQKLANGLGLPVSVCHFLLRDEQVEQDREHRSVLPDHAELAWSSVAQS